MSPSITLPRGRAHASCSGCRTASSLSHQPLPPQDFVNSKLHELVRRCVLGIIASCLPEISGLDSLGRC